MHSYSPRKQFQLGAKNHNFTAKSHFYVPILPQIPLLCLAPFICKEKNEQTRYILNTKEENLH